jgi:hypothetical protein
MKDFHLTLSLAMGDAEDRFRFGGFCVLTADSTSTNN